jgi:hypothetical protein
MMSGEVSVMRIGSNLILVTLPAFDTRTKCSLALPDMRNCGADRCNVLQKGYNERLFIASKISGRNPAAESRQQALSESILKDGLAPPSPSVSAPSFFQTTPYQQPTAIPK